MKALAVRIVFCFLALLVSLFACSTKKVLEEELLGTWRSAVPEYKDTYFELKPERICFKDREGGIQSCTIINVKREKYRSSPWLLYTLTYQDASLQKSEFSFFVNQERTDKIIFKNQKKLVWEKD